MTMGRAMVVVTRTRMRVVLSMTASPMTVMVMLRVVFVMTVLPIIVVVSRSVLNLVIPMVGHGDGPSAANWFKRYGGIPARSLAPPAVYNRSSNCIA